MTKQLDNTTALWALDVLSRYAPESVGGVAAAPRRYASDPAADYQVECFKRQCERDSELARLNSLPRATRRNDLDNCVDCGAEATHTDYRNGRAIGLCDGCY